MAPHVLNLRLEQLRAIRADLSDIKGRLGNVELNLATLGQQAGALTRAVYSGKTDLDGRRRRVQRIERRLELSESYGLGLDGTGDLLARR